MFEGWCWVANDGWWVVVSARRCSSLLTSTGARPMRPLPYLAAKSMVSLIEPYATPAANGTCVPAADL